MLKYSVRFGAVEVEQNKELERRFGIEAYPTIFLFSTNKQTFMVIQPEEIWSRAVSARQSQNVQTNYRNNRF